MKKSLFFLLLATFILKSQAQEEPIQKLNKNSIHLSFGTFAVVSSINISYERLLLQKETDFFKNYYLNIKNGGNVTLDFSGSNTGTGTIHSIGVTGLTGLRKNHLEIGLGIGYFIQKPDSERSNLNDNFFYPNFAIGYRKQTAEGFVFRTGIGIAEWAYIGFGHSF